MVTFDGFPPLRTSVPVAMSPKVVTDVLGALQTRLDAHAVRMTSSVFVDCEHYRTELERLNPTSPFAQRHLADVLLEREISTTRFTRFVRENPAMLRDGVEQLAMALERRIERLRQVAPSGCSIGPHWLLRRKAAFVGQSDRE